MDDRREHPLTMRRLITKWLLASWWQSWRRWGVWLICASSIALLGYIRIATDAEFTFASLVVLPILVIALLGGMSHGLALAAIAALMWAVVDFAVENGFSADWIPWVNGLTRWGIYSLVAVLAALVGQQLRTAHRLATTDGLTQLPNRSAFLEAGADEAARAQRYEHPIAVIFLDLDKFKQLNDHSGHDVGDAALRAASRALRSTLRSTDAVGRLGGDEFAVALPEISYAHALDAGKKIRDVVSAALAPFPPAAVSVGVAWFEAADRSFPAMLKLADEAMYEAKREPESHLHITSQTRSG